MLEGDDALVSSPVLTFKRHPCCLSSCCAAVVAILLIIVDFQAVVVILFGILPEGESGQIMTNLTSLSTNSKIATEIVHLGHDSGVLSW